MPNAIAIGIGIGITFPSGQTAGGGPPPATFRILLEDGFHLLAENGDFLRKEQNS